MATNSSSPFHSHTCESISSLSRFPHALPRCLNDVLAFDTKNLHPYLPIQFSSNHIFSSSFIDSSSLFVLITQLQSFCFALFPYLLIQENTFHLLLSNLDFGQLFQQIFCRTRDPFEFWQEPFILSWILEKRSHLCGFSAYGILFVVDIVKRVGLKIWSLSGEDEDSVWCVWEGAGDGDLLRGRGGAVCEMRRRSSRGQQAC